MKKLLKITGFALLGIIILAVIGRFIFNEPLPKGEQGAEADALATKVLQAINKPAWDTTRFVTWTFRGTNNFLWDKERHLVRVQWKQNEVYINPNEGTGKAFKKGEALSGEKNNRMVRKAIDFFNNDSFWLNAPSKVFDSGTERRICELEDGTKGLLITYTSGGTTPGDSYLWLLDEQGLPTAWKMWVKIIPIGGLGTTWANWQELPGGAKIATEHKLGNLGIAIENVKGGQRLYDIGIEQDPFVVLE